MSSKSLPRSDRLVVRWIDWVQQHPWRVLAVALLVVAAAASGLPKLGFSNNYRAYFSPDNPELVAFEALQATYSRSDNILFVVQPAAGDVFEPEAAAAIERLTERAWKIPYASRVDSLTNFQHSWADGDDLTVEDLLADADSLSPQELARRRSVALAEPLLAGSLLAADARTTGVNVILQFPEESLGEVPEAVAAAREIVRQAEQELPGSQVALSGITILNHAFTESGQRDAATLIPLMFVALCLVMALLLRSITGMLATLAVVAISTLVALGLAGHLGIQLSPVAINSPIIIMTLAVADCVHILVSMLAAWREGADKATALTESVRINLAPVIITSLTTAIGFLALNFSDTPPFHALGNICALGFTAALVGSLSVLPALATVLPMRPGRRSGGHYGLSARLDRFGGWLARRWRTVLGGAGLIVLITLGLLPLVDLDDQWVDYFDHRLEFRRDADFALTHLAGLYPVEISVSSGVAEGINDPEYLAHLQAFTEWLRTQPEVRHVFSYSDIVRRLNKNLHGDDEAYFRVPERRDLAAQYLLLYELSLPFGLDLSDRISVDKSATRVTATLGDVTTRDTRDFLVHVEEWLRANTPDRMHTSPSGPPVMFAFISQRNIESMLRGNLVAVLLIVGILAVALRSFRLGLLSLIPNSVPVLMTFGIWGLTVGKVGMASAMVSVCSLGIIVDDTVHFLSKYLRARRERGLEREQAIRYAFRTVGSALIATTVILTAGFLVLSLSTFRINLELGSLTALAIVLALLTDFFLLPALLLWGHREGEAKG